jgi:hypothetical protein
MTFEQASEVSSLCWELRQADYSRGLNRARINNLFNGAPPYTEDEVEANGIEVNVNFLESTRLAHDARSAFTNAFMKPGMYFRVHTDRGPEHLRTRFGTIVSKELNRIMKLSLCYTESLRSKFSQLVLHGIGPNVWQNAEEWCPHPIGVEDLLVPSNTFLHFKNLPFFCVLRDFTAPELIKLTRGEYVDPGWNLDLVRRALEYIDTESAALMGTNYPDIWSPEKMEERIKGDGTFYSADSVAVLNTFDFYYWSDEGKHAGWRRRIVVDDWTSAVPTGVTPRHQRGEHDSDLRWSYGEWLYNSGEKVFADERDHIFHCSFADLSAVGPFRYHSVRSLGFLLYGACHIQNRLRCKLTESSLEALMMYFRIKSADDLQRALKVDLINRGFIDDTIQFIPANERFQVNSQLVELGIQQNSQMIGESASSYSQSPKLAQDRTHKTKFQVMAELQSASAMVGAALNQAYMYQEGEYREIFRRFMRPDSVDPGVRDFRAACLRQGVPEELLETPECWDLAAERVMGQGNKTLEMTIAQQLMEWRQLFDPEPQREILRDSVLALTDDPARSQALVPEQPQVSETIHDTELAFGAIMQGSQITPKKGLNAIEVCGRMLQLMGMKVQQIMQQGGVGTPQDVQGLAGCAQYVSAFMKILAQDENQMETVKKFGDMLKNIMNQVKAMMQRQQEMAKKAAQQGAQGNNAQDIAKVRGMQMQAQAKAKITEAAGAQKLRQKDQQFKQKLAQDAESHGRQRHLDMRQHEAELAKKEMEAYSNIANANAESEATIERTRNQPANDE